MLARGGQHDQALPTVCAVRPGPLQRLGQDAPPVPTCKKWRNDAATSSRPEAGDCQPSALPAAPKHAAAFDKRSKAILRCLQHYGFIKTDSLCDGLIPGTAIWGRVRRHHPSTRRRDCGVSVIAIALKHMLADGIDSDAIVAAVAEMEREMTSGVDRAAEKRREWDREGMRKQRNLSGGNRWNRVAAEPFPPRRSPRRSPTARQRSIGLLRLWPASAHGCSSSGRKMQRRRQRPEP